MKRSFDILICLIFFILGFPILLIICALIRFFIGKPILFKQVRIGLNNQPFMMYKFRTMTNDRDKNNNLLPDELRTTRFGNFLRSASLDELPGLWNVLKGDMSLVGPRPLLVEYLPLYSEEQIKRHNVLPGITGWAQVNGRNALDWPTRFQYDVWYVNNHSFLLDLKILFLTVYKVFKKSNINKLDGSMMEPFRGNKN